MNTTSGKPFAEQGNYTEMHNQCFDHIMPRVSSAAFKVLCLVLRRTRGEHKKSVALSYSDIKDGIGAGNDNTIAKALTELTSSDIFESPVLLKKEGEAKGNAAASRQATQYALNPNFAVDLSAQDDA